MLHYRVTGESFLLSDVIGLAYKWSLPIRNRPAQGVLGGNGTNAPNIQNVRIFRQSIVHENIPEPVSVSMPVKNISKENDSHEYIDENDELDDDLTEVVPLGKKTELHQFERFVLKNKFDKIDELEQ